MLLKDIMGEKQLNFDKPLISVRRFSSKVASETEKTPHLPAYKSELKSGPLRNAGNVPFLWEKTPGRPKDETKLHTQVVEQPYITPNLPPGRVSKLNQQDSDAKMRTGSTLSRSQNVESLIREVTKHESSLEEKNQEEKESSDSDDGDETFLDALDMSSSMSGWDDDHEDQVHVQPYGSFSSDQQARDFIIDRFLPAAKAMTSKTPQYSSRKPLVGQEQHKKKAVNTEKRSPPLSPHRPESLRHYMKHIDREGSEDESDNCNGSENYTTTGCGLFQRFCLLNQIPGSSVVDKRAKPTYYGKKSLDSNSDFSIEKVIFALPEKFKHGTDPHLRDSSYESSIVEKTLHVDYAHKVKSETNHRGDDFETLIRDSGIYKNLPIDSSVENSKRLDIANVKLASLPKSSESLETQKRERESPSKKIDSEKQRMKKPGNYGSDLDQDLVMTSGFERKKIDSEVQVPSNEKSSGVLIQNSEVGLKSQGTAKWIDENIDLEMESKCVVDLDHTSDDANYFEIPLVLPSLKAPSESWLKRTLPAISSRNIHSQSNLARSQTPKTESLYPQWETSVKSSNVHHEHLQLHEEPLTPIPED